VNANGLLLAIPLVLLVLLTLQGRRRGRALRDAQSQVTPGAVVMTGAGMFATVVSVDGDQVTLETSPGQTSRWLRQAVVRVVTPAPTGMHESIPLQEPAPVVDDAPVVEQASVVDDVAERPADLDSTRDSTEDDPPRRD
jgi:preprotein translocase subunit YajC